MRITFKFDAILRGLLGEKQAELDLSEAATVEEAFRSISDKYGQIFSGNLPDRKGNAALMIIDIQVNGKSITVLQGFNTKLSEGDEISFLPLVTGG